MITIQVTWVVQTDEERADLMEEFCKQKGIPYVRVKEINLNKGVPMP